MTSIDKAAIAFTVAIVAIGVGFAFVGEGAQNSSSVAPPVPSAPTIPQPAEEPKAQNDPFEELASEVREGSEVEEMEAEVEEMEEPSGPQTVSVDMPSGTSVPGCEETNECYVPSSVTINVGDAVEWINSDTAAHTVTGGSPAEGPSGVFDSSLVLGGAQYAFTFEETGSFDYFCMVHPWMVGNVQVN